MPYNKPKIKKRVETLQDGVELRLLRYLRNQRKRANNQALRFEVVILGSKLKCKKLEAVDNSR